MQIKFRGSGMAIDKAREAEGEEGARPVMRATNIIGYDVMGNPICAGEDIEKRIRQGIEQKRECDFGRWKVTG